MSGEIKTVRQRERAIDLFKGLLVLGMVYCHALQFFSDPLVFPEGQKFIEGMNLITFSGFVFSFGYVCQLAYYSKSFQQAWRRMLTAGVKTLFAFYISGAAFRLLIDKRPLEWATIRPILLLDDMPGWSEFLASFTYLILLGLLLFMPLKRVTEKKWTGFALAGMLLLTTLIPYGNIHAPQLAPLLGTRDFASFPVLPYFPYYLLGMLFARHRIVWDWKVLSGAAALSGAFAWKWLLAADAAWPERFPPSMWWILGPALPLYGYYLLSRGMQRYPLPFAPLEAMGRNVLWFLVMSNVLIFALESAQPQLILSLPDALWVELALLGTVGFSIWAIYKPSTKKLNG
ncbi:acyltransferase family protein [Paenibacillus macerans]|uniref:acyltransferase family protein n=1 Tax=Paenibacillus macerans TaxID=44252 RepID=UPI003D311E94